jgi:hypothetical protein
MIVKQIFSRFDKWLQSNAGRRIVLVLCVGGITFYATEFQGDKNIPWAEIWLRRLFAIGFYLALLLLLNTAAAVSKRNNGNRDNAQKTDSKTEK